ncbi:MAG: serine/threonine protein kinase [Deltaproteobacteria bacterium]|nr:serine/threonine protein kinase [Deltaproteobacteria bacterium]
MTSVRASNTLHVSVWDSRGLGRAGRYEILHRIAAGGMAELYLARYLGPSGFEKRCAIKRVLPQHAVNDTFSEMFLNEARVTALFDHPNIAQVFDMGKDDEGRLYIVMEHVNGLNLRQILRRCQEKGRVLPPELAGWIMAQALDGLAYAHVFREEPSGRPLNLVHRDISPQNILVSREGSVKVVDFGIAKAASIRAQTVAGMLKGKLGYMSPEQAQGDPLDARSDIFCAGICLYELIAGARPFTGVDEFSTLTAILDSPPPPIPSAAACPPGIEAAIYKALEKNPDARFQTARAFQVALYEALRETPIPLANHVVSAFMTSLLQVDAAPFDPELVRVRPARADRPDTIRPAGGLSSLRLRPRIEPPQAPYSSERRTPGWLGSMPAIINVPGPNTGAQPNHQPAHLSELTAFAPSGSAIAVAARALGWRALTGPLVWIALFLALGTISLASWAFIRPAPAIVIEPIPPEGRHATSAEMPSMPADEAGAITGAPDPGASVLDKEPTTTEAAGERVNEPGERRRAAHARRRTGRKRGR